MSHTDDLAPWHEIQCASLYPGQPCNCRPKDVHAECKREREEDRAAIRDVNIMTWDAWRVKHAAAIARATGQEGAKT